MEENENKTTFNVNAEDVKKETEETVNQVKDTIKNVDLKNDSKEAKGFFFSFFKNPQLCTSRSRICQKLLLSR